MCKYSTGNSLVYFNASVNVSPSLTYIQTLSVLAMNAPLAVAFMLASSDGWMLMPACCVNAKHQENLAIANDRMQYPMPGNVIKNGCRASRPAV